jgi:MFS family permease
MKKGTNNLSLLSFILFILIATLISSISNMISPNLIAISYYFGFSGDTTPLGVLTFSFTLATGIFMLIFGYLADKITRKWIVFCGALIFSLFALLTIVVPSGGRGYVLFFFITIITGIGYGALVPSIFSLIGDIISRESRSKGYSFFSIASFFGIVVGTGLATFIGSSDWRVPFFIIGFMGLIATILFIFFKEPSRIGKDESYLLEKDGIEYTYRINFSDLSTIFKKKANIWLVVNFVDNIPSGIILFLLYAYMEEYHGIPSEITIFVMLLILIFIILGTIIFGIIGDRAFRKGNKKARVKLALFGNIFPIPFLFVALIIPFRSPNLFPGLFIWIILFMIGMFANGAVNGNWYATVADLNLPEHRGTVLAASNFFDIIGRAIGPLIGAVVADLFEYVFGMMTAIFAWILIPFFWIPVLRNVIKEMNETQSIFEERIQSLK